MVSEHWRKTTAKQIGLRGDINFHTAKVGMTLHIPCEAGDHIVDVPVSKGLPPEAVAKHMVQKGWTIGSRLKCPDCGRNRPVRKKKGETATNIRVKTLSEAVAISKVMPIIAPGSQTNVIKPSSEPPFTAKDFIMKQPTGSSSLAVAQSQEETRRRLKRSVIEWLGECYDEDKCCYKSGFSDASIAKETGAAPQFVAEIREDLYGPMGEPDDLRQLRADFATHMKTGEAWMAEHDRVSKTFYARLERLVVKNGWKVEA